MVYRQIPPYMMWYQGPMGNMYDPMIEEEDEEDLAMLYPGLYHRAMPLVRYHGDQMEMTYGAMYSPTREEVGRVTDDIYDRLDKEMNFDEYDEQDENDDEYRGYYRNNEEEARQRPRRRKRSTRDLISVLFLRDLHRRRRRRRRRRPHHGGFGY